jgi:hypothetical protein
MGGGGAFRPAHPLHPTFRGRGRGRGWGWGQGWGPGWGFLPFPDYYDYYGDYYDNSDYEPPVVEVPQPVRVIQPILIERQGDQWVQVPGYSQSPAPAPSAPPKIVETTQLRAAPPGRNEAAEPYRELPPAVLVFRDGHVEEINSYTIIGDTLYVKANYWLSGSWSRKVEIANLDVPATLKINEEHGSKFRLPSGPQEVVIRP